MYLPCAVVAFKVSHGLPEMEQHPVFLKEGQASTKLDRAKPVGAPTHPSGSPFPDFPAFSSRVSNKANCGLFNSASRAKASASQASHPHLQLKMDLTPLMFFGTDVRTTLGSLRSLSRYRQSTQKDCCRAGLGDGA